MKTAVTILIATLLSLAAPAQTAEEIIAKMTESFHMASVKYLFMLACL